MREGGGLKVKYFFLNRMCSQANVIFVDKIHILIRNHKNIKKSIAERERNESEGRTNRAMRRRKILRPRKQKQE
jgi:hypothetical protein